MLSDDNDLISDYLVAMTIEATSFQLTENRITTRTMEYFKFQSTPATFQNAKRWAPWPIDRNKFVQPFKCCIIAINQPPSIELIPLIGIFDENSLNILEIDHVAWDHHVCLYLNTGIPILRKLMKDNFFGYSEETWWNLVENLVYTITCHKCKAISCVYWFKATLKWLLSP